MALIENLEGDGWEEFLGESFRYALYVLKHDRFRSVFSGARAAGVPHTPWQLPGRACAGHRWDPPPGQPPAISCSNSSDAADTLSAESGRNATGMLYAWKNRSGTA